MSHYVITHGRYGILPGTGADSAASSSEYPVAVRATRGEAETAARTLAATLAARDGLEVSESPGPYDLVGRLGTTASIFRLNLKKVWPKTAVRGFLCVYAVTDPDPVPDPGAAP